MSGRVPFDEGPHEDRFGPNSVLSPSVALAAAIRDGAQHGRTVFYAGDVYVPRLTCVAIRHRRGGYALGQAAEEALNARGRPFLTPEAAVFLDAPSAESAGLVSARPHAVAQLRYLAAAALHDLHGWPLSHEQVEPSEYEVRGADGVRHDPSRKSIGAHLGYGLQYHDGVSWRPPQSEEEDREAVSADARAARRAVVRGRSLWAKLAAWPWWPLAAGKHLAGLHSLPNDWWTIPDVVANWWAWRDPDGFLAEQVATRKGVRTRDLPT
jgi:hypothetical protein